MAKSHGLEGRAVADLRTPTEFAFTRSLLKNVKLHNRGKETRFPNIQSLRKEEQGKALGSLSILGSDVHSLPDEVIKELVAASVDLLAEESRNPDVQLMRTGAVSAAFSSIELPPRGFSDQNVTTKAFRAWKDVCLTADQSDPHVVDALGNWFDTVGQDGYLCDPAVFLEIQAECYQNEKIDSHIRSRMLDTLEYIASWHMEQRYFDAITQKLKSQAHENYAGAARYLEILREIYHRSASQSYDPNVAKGLRATLDEFIQSSRGKALLQLRARGVRDELSATSFHFSPEDRDAVPFRFDDQRFCFHKEGRLYVTEAEEYEKVALLVNVFNEASDRSEEGVGELLTKLDSALKGGASGYTFSSRDGRLLAKIRQTDPMAYVRKQLAGIRAHPFSLADVSPILGSATSHESVNDVQNFEFLMRPSTRRIVREEFGVSVEKLDPMEKYYFFKFIEKLDLLDSQELFRFLNAYGKDGIRALLVAEHDPQFASEIVWTGNLLLEGVITEGDPFFKEILAAYCRVLDGVNVAREVYRERVGKEMSEDEYERVGAILRQRATSILQKAVRGILGDTETMPDGTEEVKVEEIRKNLQQVEAQVVVFTCMLRALDLDPTSLKGTELQEIPGGTLRGLFKAQMEMLAIQEKQYRGRSGYSNDLVDALNAALSDAMANPDTRFFVYNLPFTTNDPLPRVGGFFRLDTRGEGEKKHLHLASVMLDPALEGGKIVEGILQKTLVKESESLPIIAECDPRSGITQKYIEWGFVATSTDVELGLTIFNIEWDSKRNAKLETVAAKVPQARIIDRAEKGAVSPRSTYYSGEEPPKFQEFFDKGYVMTRFFSRKSKGGAEKYYAAFELPPEE